MSTTTPDLAKLRAEINQHPYVKLLRSKDPMMWYSSRVGEMIRVIGVNLDGYWAREGDKYNSINVIRFSDCEWVPHPLSHITPSAPDAPQGNNPAWTLASKVREALRRKACPGYYTDVAVEAVVHNYIYAAAPSQEPAVNLSCKSTQARLAAQWGYVPAPSQPVTLTDEVFAALELDPEAFRTEGGAVNAGKLKAAILHPYNYLHPDHWLQARFSKPGGRPLVTDQAALSDEDIDKIADDYEDECGRIRVDQVFAFARVIIAALREKESQP